MFKKTSLVQLIGRTKTRINPIFYQHMWWIAKHLAVYIIAAVGVATLGSYVHDLGIDSKWVEILCGVGVAGGGISATVLTMWALLQPLEIYAFNKGLDFSIYSQKDLENFKLTPEEVQNLLECELNKDQEKLLQEFVETRGALNYIDLINLSRVKVKSAELVNSNLQKFRTENQVSFGEEEVEIKWGETKPLKNYL